MSSSPMPMHLQWTDKYLVLLPGGAVESSPVRKSGQDTVHNSSSPVPSLCTDGPQEREEMGMTGTTTLLHKTKKNHKRGKIMENMPI